MRRSVGKVLEQAWGVAGSRGFADAAATSKGIEKLQTLVRRIEQDNLAAKKDKYAADLKAGTRDKAHHKFWEDTRARFASWDAEAAKLGVDADIYSAVKELDAIEQFKTKAEALPMPAGTDRKGVEALQDAIYKLRDEQGILRRQYQVAFDRELMIRAAEGAVRKFKALVEPMVLPEAATALGTALDKAEAKLGKPVTFDDDAAMDALGDELVATGIFESLGIPPGSDVAALYAKEDADMTQAAVQDIEKEAKTVAAAFADAAKPTPVDVPPLAAPELSGDAEYQRLKAELDAAAQQLAADWK
ncbi:unnamed protein product [Pedinophyceae sp. YPF-701]|nr:unnamed protein product [Pedinophyceae sp. YPF-701]